MAGIASARCQLIVRDTGSSGSTRRYPHIKTKLLAWLIQDGSSSPVIQRCQSTAIAVNLGSLTMHKLPLVNSVNVA